MAMTQDRVYLGTGEQLEVQVRDRSGTLQLLLRGPAVPLEIPNNVTHLLAQGTLSDGEADLLAQIEALRLAFPPSLPAYSAMLTDPRGGVWLRRFDLPRTGPERWAVFDESGAFLGHLRMPDTFSLREIDSDHLLGVTQDHLGVERVVLHRLKRAP